MLTACTETLTTKEKRMKNTNDQKRSKVQEQHKQQPENRLFHIFLTLPPTDRQLKHAVCKAVRVSVCQKVFVRITFSHTTLLPKQNLQSGFSEVTLYPLFICVKCVIKNVFFEADLTKSAAVMATNLTSQFYQDSLSGQNGLGYKRHFQKQVISLFRLNSC